MSAEELEQRIKTLKKDTRILKRLYFIRYRYEGDPVETDAEKVSVYKMVAYQWQDRWNENWYEGLVPRFAGGKPAKLSKEKIERLRSIPQEWNDWTTEEVKDLIEKRFGIRFTQKYVDTILRKLGMKYAKPYQHHYRRPKNAEDYLKKLRHHQHGRTDHRFPG
ncbi:MAG: winged helix-turn-helix domain-containing protein [Conexivisphaerales archaeon]